MTLLLKLLIVVQNKESMFPQGIRTKWLRGDFGVWKKPVWMYIIWKTRNICLKIRRRGREGSKVVKIRLNLQDGRLNVKGGTVPHNVVLNQN